MATDEEFTDEQNFDVDIDAFYQKIIVKIDNTRSLANIHGNINRDFQESRCHAFYRYIGLPIVSTDGQSLYSPGKDIPNNSNNKLIQEQSQIASKISKDINKLMDAKEKLPKDYLSIFSTQGIDASYLAMSSVDIRSFSSPFPNLEDAKPFDVDAVKNSTFTSALASDLKGIVQDSNNNFPTSDFSSRPHILKPFMVDPRIDNAVQPSEKRLRVPFLAGNSEAKIRDDVFLKGPYIETVCRERFDISSKSTIIGDNTKKIIENIKSDKSDIKDQELLSSIFNPDLISEEVQIANYINIIRSMLKKLSDSIDIISKVMAADPESNGQAEYNWVPIPNARGPEYGSVTRDVINQPDDISNTVKDTELISILYKQQIASMTNKFKAQDKVQKGSFAFENTEFDPGVNATDVWGDKTNESINELKSRRKAMTDQANTSLREIEIIMGEFSGLGLCDILAIMTALWAVDKTTLLSLLDDTAIERMANDPNLQSIEVLARNQGQTMTPLDALANFEIKVKETFNLMDSMYKDIRSKNKR